VAQRRACQARNGDAAISLRGKSTGRGLAATAGLS
jgi:hypothetical protein